MPTLTCQKCPTGDRLSIRADGVFATFPDLIRLMMAHFRLEHGLVTQATVDADWVRRN